jgi:YbbR domain-containing protein
VTGPLRIVLHNWPLKVGAIALATLLYGGLVLTERSRVFPDSVPIEGLNRPTDVVLLSDLGVVREIRYFTADEQGVLLDTSSFRATVDLANVDPSAGAVSRAVRVEAIDPRVSVLDWEPKQVNVRLDQIVRRTVPVIVDRGVVPPGLDVREAVVSASEVAIREVVVRGPESIVRRVVQAEARVRIDPSGLDVNQEVELVPVDVTGVQLSPVDVEPAAVRVRIAVFTDRQTRSLPVNPIVTGTPAAGWEVEAISVTPLVVTVEGDADELAPLVALDTLAVSVAGASGDIEATVAFDLPDGVLPLGEEAATVTVSLRQVAGTRTLQAGLALFGARSDRTYDAAVDRVLVTLGGPIADLDRIDAAALVATIDVSGLAPGTYELAVSIGLPTGVSLVGVAPDHVTITIGPAATPAPSDTPPP